jgi:anti-anti-sigma factor
MKLASERTGDALVVTVAGPLDAAACDPFQAALMPLVTSATADGIDVVLDFADVDTLHDFGRRTLMLAAKACRPAHTRIAIAARQPVLQQKRTRRRA